MKSLCYFYGLVLLVSACTSTPATDVNSQATVQPADSIPLSVPASQQLAFEPPFKDIDIPFSTFEYNNKKGILFDMETGSHIEIPAEAFQDQNGNPVTENISISYREFHSLSDIMLSGIKMKYNEGDTNGGDFESAGMFEIRAFQNGGELDLREGKKIKVNLASFKKGDFNHYRMNEATSNWEFIEKKDPEKNTNKEQKLESLNQDLQNTQDVCLFQPKKYEQGMEIFDLDYDLSRFRDLSLFNDAMWICVGSDEEKERLKKNLTGFNDMSLVPADSCGTFSLSLWQKNGGNSISNKRQFLVAPVWSGKAYDRAKIKLKEHVQNMKRLQDERQMAEREADLWRSFELKGMGVYNCDRVMDYVKFITVSLAIIFKDKIKSFFYITNNGSVAIKYYEYKFPEFKVNPNSTNSIIAILPDNKIGKISEAEFDKMLKAYQKNTAEDKMLELELKEYNLPVTDKKSFEQHVASF
ncbi:MAG: hypothetical protein HYZ14_05215 [Bacteroidetes bacterium]|nr:hypothetical protein [Bacteroidota bacterium]